MARMKLDFLKWMEFREKLGYMIYKTDGESKVDLLNLEEQELKWAKKVLSQIPSDGFEQKIFYLSLLMTFGVQTKAYDYNDLFDKICEGTELDAFEWDIWADGREQAAMATLRKLLIGDRSPYTSHT